MNGAANRTMPVIRQVRFVLYLDYMRSYEVQPLTFLWLYTIFQAIYQQAKSDETVGKINV